MTMQSIEGVVRSADGTSIGFVKFGSGPALACVHGSLTTGGEWVPFAMALADRFTCVLVDRRGRGRSENSMNYSIEKECEDIKAVLGTLGERPNLLGHSYGAICALEVARAFPLGKLILYEPPLPMSVSMSISPFGDYKAAVERQSLDEALLIGLRDIIGMPEEVLAGLRETAMWTPMAQLTPTWVREIEETQKLELGVERYRGVPQRTLLLVGSATAPHHLIASRALAQILKHSEIVEFPGHGHQAHLTATDSFAAEVANFLSR